MLMLQDIDLVSQFMANLIHTIIYFLGIGLSISLFIILIVLMRYGGIGTYCAMVRRGGVIRIYKAHETDKSIVVRGVGEWAKAILHKGEKEAINIAEPVMYMRYLRPRRLFLVQEGYPTVIPWFRETPILPVTAEDLSMLGKDKIAKALVNAFITKIRRDWVMVAFAGIALLVIGILYGHFMWV